MAKKLVLKAAPKPPDKSPDGAEHVFTDDNGISHYQDGAVWAPDEDEDEDSAEEADESPDEEAAEEDDEGEDEDDEDEGPPDSGDGDDNRNGVDTDDSSEEDDPADVVPEAKDASSAGTSKVEPSDSAQEDSAQNDKTLPPNQKKVSKSLAPEDADLVGLDALRLCTALVEKVSDIFSNTELSKRDDEYEAAMLGFNRAMDRAAIENWLAGSSVSKRDNTEAVTEAVEAITKIYENVVETVGGVPVSKNDGTETDIYKGLSPEVAEIVKRSEQVIEERETEKWTGVAKGFKNVPAEPAALGAALRTLHGSNPEQYEVVRAALAGSDAALADGEVFKSVGRAGIDSQTTDITKRAEELVSKGEYKTTEQAAVALMEKNPSEFYKPTA